MVSTAARTWLLGSGWLATLVVIVASSVAMGARLSTSAFLLVVCAVPMGVMLLIGLSAPSPTVAEILYSVNNKQDGRR
ncbi:MAG TPA: hypothetical protein VGY48_12625 [Vicinamibacterales bacterium]|nr:hypothetical protein [Vicinamibacterales bacterium]